MSIDQAPAIETHNHVMNIVIGIGDAVRRARQTGDIQPPNDHGLDIPYVLVATPYGDCSRVFIEDLVVGEQYTLVPDSWNPIKQQLGGYADEVRLMVPLGSDKLQVRTVEKYTGAFPRISSPQSITDSGTLIMIEQHVDDLRPIGPDEYTIMLQERLKQASRKNSASKRKFGSRIMRFFEG